MRPRPAAWSPALVPPASLPQTSESRSGAVAWWPILQRAIPEDRKTHDGCRSRTCSPMSFPRSYQAKIIRPIRSNGSTARSNAVIVSIFPNWTAIRCLVGLLLLEQNDSGKAYRIHVAGNACRARRQSMSACQRLQTDSFQLTGDDDPADRFLHHVPGHDHAPRCHRRCLPRSPGRRWKLFQSTPALPRAMQRWIPPL